MPSTSGSRRVSAVLPAGGSGTRMRLEVPKQFVEIEGRPLYSFALETFVDHPGIDRVALVIPPTFRDSVQRFLSSKLSSTRASTLSTPNSTLSTPNSTLSTPNSTLSTLNSTLSNYSKVVLIDGAETRHRSIWNGIEALERFYARRVERRPKDGAAVNEPSSRSCFVDDDDDDDDDDHRAAAASRRPTIPGSSSSTSFSSDDQFFEDLVVIHDAVRPFLDVATLDIVVDAAWRHGAAGVVLPLVSTVVRPDERGFLQETLVRADYRASEMPQAFSLSLMSAAYSLCTDDELDYGTECLEVARKYGAVRPKLVEARGGGEGGGNNLWKVTYPQDLDKLRTNLEKKKEKRSDKCD